MPSTLTRRQFLRSAGGVTFLALTPVGRGLFAAVADTLAPMPLFTALPYIQPGPDGRLVPGKEIVRLAWQTEPKGATFTVEFGPDDHYGHTATITRTQRDFGKDFDPPGRFNYIGAFEGLALRTQYHYRVRCNGTDLMKGFFTTRQPRGSHIRFAAFGDNGCALQANRVIAHRVHQSHPDFIINAGDNVYDCGRDEEYRRYFFPVYNADTSALDVGGPVMRSVPYYTVLANHDLNAEEPENKLPVAHAGYFPDLLAYYTNFHFPLNGPEPTYPTSICGPANRIDNFKACAGPRFPRMANYSFDCGDAHFLCLDANTYVDPTDEALQRWIAEDLAATDAIWKLVVYHHPAFTVGNGHYSEQHMRALAPLFEQQGVDLVIAGHEHGYQRNMPFRFAPRDLTKAHAVRTSDRFIPGTFTLDTKFDGVTQTRPDGVLYITTGAGGQSLHDADMTNRPARWLHHEDDHVAYCSRLIADRNSFSIIEIEGAELSWVQIDELGQEIDRFRVTKT